MIPSIPADKANHMAYCAALAAVTASATIATGHAALAPAIADLTVLTVALVKEAHDARINYKTTGNWRTGPHGVEPADVLAGVLGGWAVTMPLRAMLWGRAA
jgi:hypothetical protein